MKPSLKAALGIVGALVAMGFVLASAAMNYVFGASLGRTPAEAHIYGTVSVLAVLFNALCPFFLSWAREGRRHAAVAAAACLWFLCLSYSWTSALGFAAENRGGIASARQVIQDELQSALHRLADLEATRAKYQRPPKELDDRIDRLRGEISALRKQTGEAGGEQQTHMLSRLSFGLLDSDRVRSLLTGLFAIMVEAGAALGLFAVLSHSSNESGNDSERREDKPKAQPVTASRWLPKAQRKS